MAMPNIENPNIGRIRLVLKPYQPQTAEMIEWQKKHPQAIDMQAIEREITNPNRQIMLAVPEKQSFGAYLAGRTFISIPATGYLEILNPETNTANSFLIQNQNFPDISGDYFILGRSMAPDHGLLFCISLSPYLAGENVFAPDNITKEVRSQRKTGLEEGLRKCHVDESHFPRFFPRFPGRIKHQERNLAQLSQLLDEVALASTSANHVTSFEKEGDALVLKFVAGLLVYTYDGKDPQGNIKWQIKYIEKP